MKKAFTLLELVFVIVIIGILATFIIPSTKTNPVQEAAIQLVSHIKYTQHLAMMDDKFNAADSEWYKTMWQIRFTNGSDGSDGMIAYAIFSDWKNTHTSHPELDELAKDPLSGDVITGGVTNAIHYLSDGVYSKANLGATYGILDLDFSSSCNNSMRISFDHLGRPNNMELSSSTSYVDAMSELITQTCSISICSVADCSLASDGQKATILIEPETGYTHIQ